MTFSNILHRVLMEQTEAPTVEPEEEPGIEPSPWEPKPEKQPYTPIRPAPGQDPEPKASSHDIELFKRARINRIEEAFDPGEYPNLVHPDKLRWLASGDDELEKLLPKLSEGEQTYLEVLASKSYQDMLSRYEKYLGISIGKFDLPGFVSLMYQSLERVKALEASHKRELEQFAVDFVLGLEEFSMVKEAVENGEVRLKVALKSPEIKFNLSKSKQGLEPKEKMNLSLTQTLWKTDPALLQRRLASLLTQGGAMLKMYAFNLVNKELQRIDDKLPALYGLLGVGAQLGYWIAPFGVEAAAAGSSQVGGAEQVKPEEDIYVIHAEAIIFPYLVYEISKGIYDWLQIVPEFTKLGKRGVEHETPDILVGTEVFKLIQSYLSTEKYYLLPLVQKKVIQLDPEEVKDVLSGSSEGKSIMQDLIQQAEDEWDAYKAAKREGGYFGESLQEDLKKEFVDEGGIPSEDFEKLVRGDPSRSKKYTRWMLLRLKENPGRVPHILDVVRLFDEMLVRNKLRGEERDIYRYGSLEEVENLISKFSNVPPTLAKVRKAHQRPEVDYRIIKDTPRYQMYEPLTHEWSRVFGQHTTDWCTTKEHSSYWDMYFKKSRLYYILDKKTGKRYAVVKKFSGGTEVFDEKDKVISMNKLKSFLGIKENVFCS